MEFCGASLSLRGALRSAAQFDSEELATTQDLDHCRPRSHLIQIGCPYDDNIGRFHGGRGYPALPKTTI